MTITSKLAALLFILLCTLAGLAQSEEEFNYQGVVRDNAGDIFSNSPITIRVSLIDGVMVYQETHATTTSEWGVFNISVGSGTPVIGNYTTLDWSTVFSLTTEINLGSGYVNFGTEMLRSVPRANHAKTADYALSAPGSNFWAETAGGGTTSINGDVSIGNIEPEVPFHVKGGSSVVFGDSQGGEGSKLYWDADHAAFRCGSLYGYSATYWQVPQVGDHSVAFGQSTIASGDNSFAHGRDNVANGEFDFVMGANNVSNGHNGTIFGEFNAIVNQGSPPEATIVWGNNNSASGDLNTLWGSNNNSLSNYATCWGKQNFSDGEYSTIWGEENATTSPHSTIFGKYNYDLSYSAVYTAEVQAVLLDFNGLNTVFGSLNSVSTDAVASTVWGIGNEVEGPMATCAGASNFMTSNAVNSVCFGDRNFVYKPRSFTAGELCTNNGNSASVFGFQNVVNSDRGMVWGEGNTVEGGENSTAWGKSNLVQGQFSTSFGYGHWISAEYGTAFGYGNIVLNTGGVSWGRSNTSAGMESTSFGNLNTSIGDYSTAWGQSNLGLSYCETVFGCFSNPAPSGFASTWVATDRLLTIGNGTVSGNSNALVLLKNGNLGLGVDNPLAAIHLSADDKIQWSGGNTPTIHRGADFFDILFKGDLNPTADNSFIIGALSQRWQSVFAVNGVIQTSDLRDKENIKNLGYGLKEVMAMRPVSYTWIETPYDGTKVGFIAQELEVIVPEVVVSEMRRMGENGELIIEESERLGVNYAELIPILVSAMQEQQAQIDALQQELANLKKP